MLYGKEPPPRSYQFSESWLTGVHIMKATQQTSQPNSVTSHRGKISPSPASCWFNQDRREVVSWTNYVCSHCASDTHVGAFSLAVAWSWSVPAKCKQEKTWSCMNLRKQRGQGKGHQVSCYCCQSPGRWSILRLSLALKGIPGAHLISRTYISSWGITSLLPKSGFVFYKCSTRISL